MPVPSAYVRVLGGDRLPDSGIAQGLDAKRRDGVKVGGAMVVARINDLVAELVSGANNRAFEPAPQFERLYFQHHRAFLTYVKGSVHRAQLTTRPKSQ